MAVATGGGGVYVGGMVTGSLGTPLPGTTPGGLDGFLARFTTAGAASWTKQVGTTADEQIWGVAADASGNATVDRLHERRPVRDAAGRQGHRRRDVRSGRRGHAPRPARHDRQRQGRERLARRRRQHLRLRVQRRQPRDEHRQLRRRARQVRPGPDAACGRGSSARRRATAPIRSPRATSSSRRGAPTIWASGFTLGQHADPDAGRATATSSSRRSTTTGTNLG